jgi:hypothetical protein
MFSKRIDVVGGETLERDGFVFADLRLVDAPRPIDKIKQENGRPGEI